MRRQVSRLRRWVVAALTVGLLAVPALTVRAAAPRAPGAAASEPAEIVVDAATQLGPTNPALRGMVWNTGPIDGLIPIQPTGMRIDASLQSISTGPDALDLSRLLTKISEVRRTGAEPLVILSYMPRWLSSALPNDPRDATRVGPRDLEAWQRLIEQVVEGVALVPGGARRFEVWNEPNFPTFWQDTPAAFLQMAIRTHEAVAAVESRHPGLDLEVGGPATALADLSFIAAYHTATTAAGQRPDFISWHWYGALGQDGNEGHFPDPVYAALTVQDNPFNTPMLFGPQVEAVRRLVGDDVPLMINEWNVAGGGYDFRHDTHEGAAFHAGALTEMERAGLDEAFLYRAQDDPSNNGRIGDWGLVDAGGTPKPGWWVFDAWRRTDGTRIAASGDDPADGFWARATRAEGRLDVILSSFSNLGAATRTVTLRTPGFAAHCSIVQTIDSPDDAFAGGIEAPVAGDLTVNVPSPSVVWVRLLETCQTGAPPCRPHGAPPVAVPQPKPCR